MFALPVLLIVAVLVVLLPFLFGELMGPLVRADLLHLRDIEVGEIGVVSVGGAGTFDGIVLSGIVAAYLA